MTPVCGLTQSLYLASRSCWDVPAPNGPARLGAGVCVGEHLKVGEGGMGGKGGIVNRVGAGLVSGRGRALLLHLTVASYFLRPPPPIPGTHPVRAWGWVGRSWEVRKAGGESPTGRSREGDLSLCKTAP